MMNRVNNKLTSWNFAFGDSIDVLHEAQPVQVPHTWSTEADTEAATGTGWYQTKWKIANEHQSDHHFLTFEAVYRDCTIFINGQEAGQHTGSGYTEFTIEITPFVTPGEEADIIVKVQNDFSTQALPYGRSFDWANDGGILRPVHYWHTGACYLQSVHVIAQPIIMPDAMRQEKGSAIFGFQAQLSGDLTGCTCQWRMRKLEMSGEYNDRDAVLLEDVIAQKGVMAVPPRILDSIDYWHFDQTNLYRLSFTICGPNDAKSDECWVEFGFRSLCMQGEQWLLNGEPVRLPGLEWMPGSDPEHGLAETHQETETMLGLLKGAHVTLTRFHWQQSQDVLDWCDRHGILVQEEIPFWGKQPEGDPEALWPIVEQQIQEMIEAHRHHPCIIAWGVGNELSAHEEAVKHYIRKAVALVRKLDPTRLCNYVTNTAWQDMFSDGTQDGDVLMINDYIGTWHQGLEQDHAWDTLTEAHPGRLFIPAEFGLCEPAFPGGDEARSKIFLEKIACYRRYPQIAGIIAFSLNDYRTHMGEEGEGRTKQRVHGSTDLLGNVKPSYQVIKDTYAPFSLQRSGQTITISCKDTLPCYAMKHYLLEIGTKCYELDLQPGESKKIDYLDSQDVQITLYKPDRSVALNLPFEQLDSV